MTVQRKDDNSQNRFTLREKTQPSTTCPGAQEDVSFDRFDEDTFEQDESQITQPPTTCLENESRITQPPGTLKKLKRSSRKQYQAQRVQVLGEMTAKIIHDLSNMHTCLDNSLDLLEPHICNPDAQGNWANAKEASSRAIRLVQRLRDFERNNSRQRQFINVNSQISELVELLRLAMPKMIQIEIHHGAQLRILANPEDIEQIVMNLIINARDAIMEKRTKRPDFIGDSRVSILLKKVMRSDVGWKSENSDHKVYGVIEVQDDGCGMEPAICEKIFEPHFTTKDEQGSGLGLATVRDTAVKIGGWAQAIGLPGFGATFTVYLPIVRR